MLGAASSESFPVPPPAPPACSRQEARWGSSRDTDLADHVLGGGSIWKRAEEGQGRSCRPLQAWHRAPASPPTPLRAAPPPQPSTALPHPNVPHAHTPRRPRHPRHQLRAAGRTTSSVPRAQQESRHVSTPRSSAEAVRRREPCIIPGTAITAGSQSRERRGPALQRIDAGTGGDAQGWDVMPQHGRARLLRGSVAGWGRIQPGPRGAAAAEQPIRNRSADWGWRKGRPVSRRRRRADGWGLSAAAERPRTAHQSQAAAGRWEHYREHYKDHWAAPDPIGAPIPATAYSYRPRGGNPRHSCGPAAALGFPDLWAQRDEGGVALPTFYLGSRAALQRARVREGVQHHAAI